MIGGDQRGGEGGVERSDKKEIREREASDAVGWVGRWLFDLVGGIFVQNRWRREIRTTLWNFSQKLIRTIKWNGGSINHI